MPFTDSYQASRVNTMKNTTHPAAFATAYLALYSIMPASDGTGGTEVTGTRSSVTFGSVAKDTSGRTAMSNSSAVTSITLANTSAATIVGFAICSASTAGTVEYMGPLYPFNVAALATITIPVGAIVVYAEHPALM